MDQVNYEDVFSETGIFNGWNIIKEAYDRTLGNSKYLAQTFTDLFWANCQYPSGESKARKKEQSQFMPNPPEPGSILPVGHDLSRK